MNIVFRMYNTYKMLSLKELHTEAANTKLKPSTCMMI